MLKIITTLTLILFGWLAKAQEVENRNISGFSKVVVSNGIELVYTESDQTHLQIETEDLAQANKVFTEVKGNTLKIYLDKNEAKNQQKKPIKVYLFSKNIEAIEANLKATITIENEISAPNFSIVLNSGASFKGNVITTAQTKLIANAGTVFNGKIDAATFKGDFKKDAKINLTGSAQNATFETSDTAFCTAKNFIAHQSNINASGKSLVLIYIEKSIALNVSEDARVIYTGFPDKVAFNEEAEAFRKIKCTESVTVNY